MSFVVYFGEPLAEDEDRVYFYFEVKGEVELKEGISTDRIAENIRKDKNVSGGCICQLQSMMRVTTCYKDRKYKFVNFKQLPQGKKLNLADFIFFFIILLSMFSPHYLYHTETPVPGVYSFSEVKPQSLPNKILYDRKNSALKLACTLLSRIGARETAFMDDCYGAGKTFLAYRFRELLPELVEDCWDSKPKDFDTLMTAIYLHIPCRELDISIDPSSINQPAVYDILVLKLLAQVLQVSAKHALSFDCSSIDSFIISLLACAESTKFLFHIDEIGIYEKYGDRIASNMIYRLWRVGDALKSVGHFFIITGRSRLLRTIGLNTNRTGHFSSPNFAIMIPLPLLTDKSVECILADENILTRVKEEQLLSFICKLCSGVPRAVLAVVTYFQRNIHIQTDYTVLLQTVCFYCLENTALQGTDRALFIKCLQYCWTETYFHHSAQLFSEPISCIIARLGIYMQSHPIDDTTIRLVVPLYMYLRLDMSEKSLLAIAQGSEIGTRLGSAFRSQVLTESHTLSVQIPAALPVPAE